MKNKNIFLFFNFLFISNIIYSCDCNFQTMSVGKIIRYDLVFEGEVLEKQMISDTISQLYFPTRSGVTVLRSFKYIFKIKKRIKGDYDKSIIEIRSSLPNGSCGVNYSVGDELYIYAYQIQDSRINRAFYNTGSCSQNLKVCEASKRYKKIIRQYKRSKKVREWKDINNNLIAKGSVAKRNPVGEWIIYHKDGSVKSNGEYSDGKKEGRWDYYYPEEYSLKIMKNIEKDILDMSPNENNIIYRYELYDQGKKIKDVKLIESG